MLNLKRAILALLLLALAPAAFAASGGIPANRKPTITCTTVCSIAGLPVGGTALIWKGSSTARTSTTTSAADPDLQYTNAPSGSYSYTIYFQPSAMAGGLKWRFTTPSNNNYGLSNVECGSGVFTHTRPAALTDVSCADTVWQIWSATGVILTSGGTLTIDWAQAASNVSASTMSTALWWIERVQ